MLLATPQGNQTITVTKKFPSITNVAVGCKSADFDTAALYRIADNDSSQIVYSTDAYYAIIPSGDILQLVVLNNIARSNAVITRKDFATLLNPPSPKPRALSISNKPLNTHHTPRTPDTFTLIAYGDVSQINQSHLDKIVASAKNHPNCIFTLQSSHSTATPWSGPELTITAHH